MQKKAADNNKKMRILYLCVAAVAVLVWQAFRKHDKEKLFVNRVAVTVVEEAAAEDESTEQDPE